MILTLFVLASNSLDNDFLFQQHQFCIFSLRFSQDSKEILGGANDGRIYVYNRETNSQVNNLHYQYYKVIRVFVCMSCLSVCPLIIPERLDRFG